MAWIKVLCEEGGILFHRAFPTVKPYIKAFTHSEEVVRWSQPMMECVKIFAHSAMGEVFECQNVNNGGIYDHIGH